MRRSSRRSPRWRAGPGRCATAAARPAAAIGGAAGSAVETDWDVENAEHLARHGVDLWEAEEVLRSRNRIQVGHRTVGKERRATIVGATDDGRILLIVTTMRGRKGARNQRTGCGGRRSQAT